MSLLLDEGYDTIVMDGIPASLYTDVPSSAQRTLMLYDGELRMIWNGEHRFHLVMRRSELRHPIRVADHHIVGWFPVLQVDHGIQGMEATIANLRFMDRWAAHGNDPKRALAAAERESREREEKIAKDKADEDAAIAEEFTEWANGQRVYSVGGMDPGNQDATRGGYKIMQGIPNERLDG